MDLLAVDAGGAKVVVRTLTMDVGESPEFTVSNFQRVGMSERPTTESRPYLRVYSGPYDII
jgi:hypothetical protein